MLAVLVPIACSTPSPGRAAPGASGDARGRVRLKGVEVGPAGQRRAAARLTRGLGGRRRGAGRRARGGTGSRGAGLL